MRRPKKLEKLINFLKERYKLVVLDDETFEEKASFNGSMANFFAGGAALVMLVILVSVLLIAVTPLKEYLVFNGDAVSRREISEAYAKTDSLENLVQANKMYLANLQNVISGKPVENPAESKAIVSAPRISPLLDNDKERSAAEIALRELVESESVSLSRKENNTTAKNPNRAGFINPVKGIVSNGFNSKNQHYAVDIAAKKNEAIRASLAGRVIFSEFTSQTGYVIAVQHEDNMITFYKHCSELLKKTGSFVRAGEVIAIVGNTGEYTSGPHLHFELWQNGNAVDPEKYINF